MLLALMLLLPITGAFAYSTNFTVNVDAGSVGVASAQVYIWDTNDTYNQISGLTDANGQANLTLGDMVQVTNLTSAPSPNIGVLVVPPTGTDYAFKTTRVLFMNVFANGATAPAINMTLEQGSLVKIAPKYDDNPSDATDPVIGVKNWVEIDYPEVPDNVAQITFNGADLDGEGHYSIYWPAGKQVYGRLNPDGNRIVFSAPQYYDWHYFSFAAGAAGSETIEEIIHVAEPKGAFKVTETPAVTDPSAWRILHNRISDINNFVPGQLYWFPVGTYNFNYALNTYEVPAGSGFGAAKGIWTNVIISAENNDSNPVIREFTVGGGTALTVNVKLGVNEADGDEATGLDWSVVEVEKLVDFGGYQQWMGYESTPNALDVATTAGVGIGKLYHRLSAGKYRIRVKDHSSIWPTKMGVWDNDLNSFKYIVTEPFEIADNSTANLVKDIALPQVPAFAARINATLSDSYSFATSNAIRVGYLPEPGMELGSEITYNSYTNISQNSATQYFVHIPFPTPGRKIVVMANLYDTSVDDRPPLFKVFEPFTIDPNGRTQVAPDYAIDNANFVTRSGALMLEGETTPFADLATINMEPVITASGTDFRLPASKVFGSSYSPEHLTWDQTETSFAFSFEKDRPFLLTVVEGDPNNSTALGLNGFVPYRENILKNVNISQDVTLLKAGKFAGQILVNGQALTDAQAFVRITKVMNDDWYGNAITREGATEIGGTFSVSGLESGQYNVAFSSDGIINNYASQTMPLFSKTIFVDVANPPATTLNFNLDAANLGSVVGVFNNELGEPIEGLKIGIISGQTQDPSRAERVFKCLTDAEGKLVRPTNSNPNFIPLPPGEYVILVEGIASEPQEFSYDIDDYHGTEVARVNVYSGQATQIPEVVVEREFNLTGTITEDGNPAGMVYFQVLDGEGRYITSGFTNQDGSYQISGIKPGMVRYAMMFDAATPKKFYLEAFDFSATMTTKDVALSSTTLRSVKIKAEDLAQNAIAQAPGSFILAADPQNPMAPRWYLAWAESGPNGIIEIMVPEMAGFAYIFEPEKKYYEEAGEEKVLYPEQQVIIDLAATEPQVVTWQSAVTVKVAVSNPPVGFAEKKINYIGMLIPLEIYTGESMYFDEGGEMFEWFERNPFEFLHNSDPSQPGIIYGRCVESDFVFEQAAPDRDYVFIAYEASRYLAQEDLDDLAWNADAVLFFRSFLGGIVTDTPEKLVSATFGPLADLTVISAPDVTTIQSVKDVTISFTRNSADTFGQIAWPAVFVSGWELDADFPIKVPANRAYRVRYSPQYADNPSDFLPKVDENVFVGENGKVHEMGLKKLNKLNGMMTYAGAPMDGQIVLVPEGAEVFNPDFEPISIPVRAGQFNGGVAQGYYFGYAVPMQGAPKYINLNMDSEEKTVNFDILPGAKISGKVVDENQTPIPGAAVMILRKRVANSAIDDGAQFYPYPARFGDEVIPCTPEGDFSFEAEKNVTYYLQVLAPMGYRPGMPRPVALAATDVTLENFVLAEGGQITGTLSSPAMVEARPSFEDVLQSQITESGAISVPVFDPSQLDFVIRGLDPAKKYDITIYPAPFPTGEMLAVKKFVNVDVGTKLGLVEFAPGFKVMGQLLDESGNPIKAAGVSVNLAMTLPLADLLASTTADNIRFNVRQSDIVSDPADFNPMNVVFEGMWTQTDANGQYVFNAVPPFMTAFIKTENGVSYDGVDYAIGKTESFEFPFTETATSFEKNVTLRLGGKVIGRLIDEAGQPITKGEVELGQGETWVWGNPDSEGRFTLSGLIPAPNYMLHVFEIPGRVPIFRPGISVQPGETTNVGALPVYKAVRVKGKVNGVSSALQYFFAFGKPEDMDLSTIAFDANFTVSDRDLLTRSFMQRIVGESEIFWDPGNMTQTDLNYELFAKPGKTHLGMVLNNEDKTGAMTLITWGWKAGLTLPTQEQLDAGNQEVFDLTADADALDSPAQFGMISGSVSHAVDTEASFYPEDAVIALYHVVKPEGATEYSLVNVPFPRAITNPVKGKWFIMGVPHGEYRIKVISRKFGTQFFKKIVTVGAEPVVENLVIGASVAKVSGKVVDSASNPIANAAVKMVLHDANAMTDTNGMFNFYMPLGEFVTPQLEIRKPGFATARIVEVGSYTNGFTVATDTNIGEFALEGAAGVAEIKVTDSVSGAPQIGAEVTMIVEKETTIDNASFTIYTPAEVQFADENGRAKFSSVPVGKVVKFRARNFYYVPQTVDVTTTGADEKIIALVKAAPKVFYCGRVEPIEGDDANRKLSASFDFNQVVEKTKLGLKIDGTAEDLNDTTKFAYPDIMGDRLTNMKFTGNIPVKPSVNAEVSHSDYASALGVFDVMAGFRFRKEFEVDPMSEQGFAGRMTDEAGNQLPTGLFVPPGYLPPEIESFQLKVEDKPSDPPSGVDGATFAGPTFEFTFNNSNFGGSTQQNGLFEVTIAYEEGTKLEPRWQDGNGNWSKVGIIDDSVKWDHPEQGYVTFKVSHLTKFSVLANVAGAASGLRSDFSADGVINDNDIAALIARNQLANAGVTEDQMTAANINTIAAGLLPDQTFTISIVPSTSIDDLNADGKLDDNDLAFLIGWIQLKNAGLTTDKITESSVGSVSSGLLGRLTGTLNKFPGETVNR
jgi:hypothetical protein